MRPNTPVLLTVFALALSGCQSLPVQQYQEPGLALEQYAWQLTSLSEAELNQEMEDSQQAWDSDPTPDNRARLGLVRGQPGYPGYAPAQAAEHLDAALALADNAWQPRQAAFLQLQAAQQKLNAERDAQLAASQERINALRNEVARANEKLRAISNIERELKQ